MGLDQYAFSSHEPPREIDDGEGEQRPCRSRDEIRLAQTCQAARAHARLYFQFGYRKKSVRNDRDEFNCNPMHSTPTQ